MFAPYIRGYLHSQKKHHSMGRHKATCVGKTSLAYATADMLGLELLRVQFYDSLTYDKILYDYDYQKQLLSIQAI